MTHETIRIETDARGIATLWLARPDKHNALSAQMIDELTAAAGELGARMTGGGFGGAVIALIPHSSVESTAQAIYDAAVSRGFPEPTFLVARPGEGARRLV